MELEHILQDKAIFNIDIGMHEFDFPSSHTEQNETNF